MENMIEIAKIGECLLAEAGEIEKYQEEVKAAMVELNGKFEVIAEDLERKEEEVQKLVAKREQLAELINDFKEDEDALVIFNKRIEKNEEAIQAIVEEANKLNEEANEIEKNFNELNRVLLNAEQSKNALLAFGTKYKFLIKKEDLEHEHEHPHVHEEEPAVEELEDLVLEDEVE